MSISGEENLIHAEGTEYRQWAVILDGVRVSFSEACKKNRIPLRVAKKRVLLGERDPDRVFAPMGAQRPRQLALLAEAERRGMSLCKVSMICGKPEWWARWLVRSRKADIPDEWNDLIWSKAFGAEEYVPLRLSEGAQGNIPEWAEAVTDWNQGQAEIARAHGVSRQNVSSAVKRFREHGWLPGK